MILSIKNRISTWIMTWENFWFSPVPLLNLSLMRFVMIGMMFGMYLFRLENIDLFDERSFIPRESALKLMGDFYQSPVQWFFWPDSLAFVAHIVFVILLFLFWIGLGGRAIAWLVFIFQLGFLQRNYAISFGADVVSTVFLFYFVFAESTAHLSVKSFFSKASKPKWFSTDLLTPVMYRMMQIHISVIYAYTGFEKLKGQTWWDGTALWPVLANPQMVVTNLEFVRHIPWLIPFITFTTIVFEIYFPAAMLSKKTRSAWLWMGVSFHLGIAILVWLFPFSLIMMSTYFLFIDPEYLKKLYSQGLKFLRLA